MSEAHNKKTKTFRHSNHFWNPDNRNDDDDGGDGVGVEEPYRATLRCRDGHRERVEGGEDGGGGPRRRVVGECDGYGGFEAGGGGGGRWRRLGTRC